MADRKEMLQERYEDALFALLMEDMAAIDGEALLEENERLQNDPAAQVPEELDKRCEKVIRRHFTKETAHRVGRITVKSLKRVAAAVGIAAVLFISAFAVSETLRVNTLNLIIETFDESTDLFIEPRQSGAIPEMEVGWLPDGYTLIGQGDNPLSIWYQYGKSESECVWIEQSSTNGTVLSIDTEGADVSYVEVQGSQAICVEKDDDWQLVWTTNDKSAFISIISDGKSLSREDVIRIAKGLKY